MQDEIIFTLTIEAQEMRVRYRPKYFEAADYGHFEFTSPHQPRRRIPVSETGYRSHFAPTWEVEAAPSVEEYARAVVLNVMHGTSCPDDDGEDGGQLAFFNRRMAAVRGHAALPPLGGKAPAGCVPAQPGIPAVEMPQARH
jgi:hypothetical protein